MLFADKSKRTMAISVNAILLLISCFLLILCTIWNIYGGYRYDGMVAASSTPVDTTLTFTKSQTTIKISGLYTDKNKNVLVARLSVTDGQGTKLPFKGSDYSLFVANENLKNSKGKEMDVVFGKMSTDGDFFLVIPKPNDKVYSVWILNNKSLTYNTNTTQVNASDSQKIANLRDETESSITKSLSSYKYDVKEDKAEYSEQVSQDVVTFRLTTNPAIKDLAHTPKVLDVDLITSDNSFDFKALFDEAFKKSATDELEKEYNKKREEIKDLERVLKDINDRLAINSLDAEAKNEKNKLESTIKQKESEITNISEKISQYTKLQYTSDYFTNLQTKAKIVAVD